MSGFHVFLSQADPGAGVRNNFDSDYLSYYNTCIPSISRSLKICSNTFKYYLQILPSIINDARLFKRVSYFKQTTSGFLAPENHKTGLSPFPPGDSQVGEKGLMHDTHTAKKLKNTSFRYGLYTWMYAVIIFIQALTWRKNFVTINAIENNLFLDNPKKSPRLISDQSDFDR